MRGRRARGPVAASPLQGLKLGRFSKSSLAASDAERGVPPAAVGGSAGTRRRPKACGEKPHEEHLRLQEVWLLARRLTGGIPGLAGNNFYF